MSTYRITFDVTVEDERLFLAYAQKRVDECWACDLESLVGPDETLVGRALVEAVVFSNENPSPDEIGLEFGGRATAEQVE